MDRFRPLDIQFGIAHDCLRSLIYSSHILRTEEKPDAWVSLGDICLADGLVSWSMIFGSRSQETHWKKFNEILPPPCGATVLPFSEEAIFVSSQLDAVGWAAYHQRIKDFRDNRLAHLARQNAKLSIPQVQPAYSCMLIYREWLKHLAQAFKDQGERINPTTESAEDVVSTFKKQIFEALPGGA